ncbi:hypothetical protein D7S70_00205 [Ralstonia pickettii]|jgi:hypothetical protein|nr:hypothetical protein [Ralstonia pickettii]MBB0034020.1 hypothetical protein [Ralstonia pickettii]MBB0096692.1 hypothetical protein [Ralstonia pickettii]MBB0106488.1 hypothetical protein [Ralstonia pickettii]MBB0126273.1 hypothetical protein [Ralstonia pickettii]
MIPRVEPIIDRGDHEWPTPSWPMGSRPMPDQKTAVTENAAHFKAINGRNYNDLWFYSNPVFVSVQ